MKSLVNLRLITAIALLAFITSCTKKTNIQGKLIPKDATMVFHIDGKSLSSKLSWDEIKGNTLFQKVSSDTAVPPIVKTLLDNPENSGIDIKNDLMLFTQQDSAGNITALQGTIKDTSKFKQFNSTLIKKGIFNEEEGFNFITDGHICVGWNKEKFIYVTTEDVFKLNKYYTQKERDIKSTCKSIFDLKEKKSLATDEKFSTLIETTGDMHVWVNIEQLYKNKAGTNNFSMLNLDKYYEGIVYTTTTNFENGKIDINYKTYTGKEISSTLKKYQGNSINEDMLKRIPTKDVAAVFALNFKPELIREIIKQMGVESLVNTLALKSAGFTLDDFVKANKGDVLFALTDLKREIDSVALREDYMYYKTNFNFLFTVAIGDKNAFNKLIAAGKKANKDSDSSFSFVFNTNDKYFALGKSKDDVEKYLAKSDNNNADFINKLKGNPIGGYADIQAIMKAFESDATKDSTGKKIYDLSLKMWDNAYIKGGKYSDGNLTFDIEINLLDKSTNSLKQLNQYINTVGTAIYEAKHAKIEFP